MATPETHLAHHPLPQRKKLHRKEPNKAVTTLHVVSAKQSVTPTESEPPTKPELSQLYLKKTDLILAAIIWCSTLIAFHPDWAAQLSWQRDQSHWYTWFTSNLTHWDSSHAIWNMAAMSLLWFTARPRITWSCLIAIWLIVPLTTWISPDITS